MVLLAEISHHGSRGSGGRHVLRGGEGHHDALVEDAAMVALGLVAVLRVEGVRDVLRLKKKQHSNVGQQERLANGLADVRFARQLADDRAETRALRAGERSGADLLVVEEREDANHVVVGDRLLQRLQEAVQTAVGHRKVVDLAAEDELVVDASDRGGLGVMADREHVRSDRRDSSPCQEQTQQKRRPLCRSGRQALWSGDCRCQRRSPSRPGNQDHRWGGAASSC